ncbi:MAG: hypothetical protein ABFC77_14805 [Thermoguttaceae bacterium]
MQGRRSAAWVFLAGLSVFLVAWPSPCFARHSRHHPNSIQAANNAARKATIADLQAQIAAAEKVLSDAKAKDAAAKDSNKDRKDSDKDKSKQDNAPATLDKARAAVNAVVAKEGSLRKKLHDREESLVESQPSKSDVGRARDAVKQSQTDIGDHLRRIMESPDYQAKLREVGEQEDAGRRRAEIRKNALGDDADYQAAVTACEQAKKQLEPLKERLFAGDAGWTATSDELKKAKADEKTARDRLAEIAKKTKQNGHAPQSIDSVEKARATIADAKAKLRQLGVPDKKH